MNLLDVAGKVISPNGGLKKPDFKVAVVVCTHRDVKLQVFNLLRQLENCPNPKIQVVPAIGDALIDRSRSIAASRMMEADFDYLWFIDDDIVTNTLDITKMMWQMYKDKLDIHGAAYPIKSQTDKKFAVRTVDNKDSFPVGKGAPIQEMRYLSTGCMGISRKVFQTMIDKEVVHLCHPETQKFYPFFTPMEYNLFGKWVYLSEDWAFPVTLDTKIMNSEFEWKNISDYKIGDNVFSADELSRNRNGYRNYQNSTVTDIIYKKLPTVKIYTEDGEVTTTKQHEWMTRRLWRQNSNTKTNLPVKWHWSKTELIKEGDLISSPIPFKKNPDIMNDDFAVGYLKGAWDGDGTIYEGSYQHYARLEQTDLESIHRVEKYFQKFGLSYIHSSRNLKNPNWKPMNGIQVGRKSDFSRFMAILKTEKESSDNFIKGYLSGIFDAEGSCGKNHRLQISNYDQGILDRCVNYGKRIGIYFKRLNDRVISYKDREIFLFSTQVMPAIKRKINFDGKSLSYDGSKVLHIEDTGKLEDVACLTTNSHTFFANGMFSHNCQRAIDLGFKIYCDFSIKLGHIGPYTYTFDDFFHEKAKEVEGFNYNIDIQKE